MKIRTWWFVVGALVPVILAGCQDPVQPDDLKQNSSIVVDVRNATNKPITEASVAWQRLTGVASPSSGVTRTNNAGMATIELTQVSILRDTVAVTVMPPSVGPYAVIPPITTTVPVCSDTTLQFAFDTLRACNTLTYRDTANVRLCPETGDKAATVCRVFPTSCPNVLTAVTSDSSDGEFAYSVRTVGSPATAVELCIMFTPTVTGDGYRSERTITVTASDALSGQPAFATSLTVIGTVACETCECPTGTTVVDTLDTLCVDETGTITATLDTASVTNGVDAACSIVATAVRQPQTPGLQLVDQILTTSGGAPFSNPEFTMTPTQTGPFVDTVIYRLQVKRGSSGVLKDCAEELRVILHGVVDVPRCSVSYSVDTLRKCLYQDSSTTTTVTVHNIGSCPVEVTVTSTAPQWFSVSNRYFIAEPFPDSSYRTRVEVSVVVSPSAWENNPNPAVGPDLEKFFAAEIIVQGCGGPVRFPVYAWVKKECRAFTYQCMREFRPQGYANVYAESIRLIEDRARIVYQNDNQLFSVYDVFVESITATSLDLASGVVPDNAGISYGGFIRVASNFYVPPGQNICTTHPVVSSDVCNQARSNPGGLQNPITNLQVGDVVLFYKNAGQACALIWIQEVAPDRSGGPSLNKVCMEICYPVFMP